MDARAEDVMAKRLLPTGECWCGCGAEVPVGSFFLSGHDKRAEGKLIIDVFGGIPQFLAAFGRAPGGVPVDPTDTSWLRWATALAGLAPGNGGTRFVIDYIDEQHPTGRFKRLGDRLRSNITLEDVVDFQDCTAKFRHHDTVYTIPLFDLEGLSRDGSVYVVRVHGTFEPLGSVNTPDSLRYASLARG